MVASEFAFLALGLLLGIPTGAALLVVIRARPPAPREVRLTVTPDSVPRRRSATLAMDPFSGDADSARGGPADMAWYAEPSTSAVPAAAPARRSGDMGRVTATAGPGVELVDARSENGTPVRSGVGVPVGWGADPTLAAMRREPGDAGRPGSTNRVAVAVRRADRPGVALIDRTVGAPTRDAVAVMDRPKSRSSRTRASVAAGGGVDQDAAIVGSGPGAGGDATAIDAAEAAFLATCTDERRAVDERCGLAERIRDAADRAAEALRDAQRAYDRHVAAADDAAATADPRAQRSAKDAAQRAFRAARAAAGSRDMVEAAARTWLQEINRVNAEARDANATLVREREAAVPVLASMERLTLQADAARVQAESAQQQCIAARESLAQCEEAQSTESARMPLEPSLAPGEAPTAQPTPSTPPGDGRHEPAPTLTGSQLTGGQVLGADADEEQALAAAALGGQPAIMRLLTGDRAAMQQIIGAVAGADPVEQRRWQLLLAEFVDAVVARAIEACVFDFPDDHPFWSPFSRSQDRDIALAMSSLGFRFDGLGGFADDRVPSQRDLSLALGYAGLDPMRVRRWPTEPEMATLFQDVTVAADEYLSGAAAGLTLGELVTLLGRRADGLTDLWNAWGRVRPLLLEPA